MWNMYIFLVITTYIGKSNAMRETENHGVLGGGTVSIDFSSSNILYGRSSKDHNPDCVQV